jgi:hypothetical protein
MIEFIIIEEVFNFIVPGIFKVIECVDNKGPYLSMIEYIITIKVFGIWVGKIIGNRRGGQY